MNKRVFPLYPTLFAELKCEVRAHCTESARLMLSMTCTREAAVPAKRGPAQQRLVYILASEGEERLLKCTLTSPGFVVSSGLHEVTHRAMAGGHIALARWLLGHCTLLTRRTCAECIAYAAGTRDRRFIERVCSVYHKERASIVPIMRVANLLTVACLRHNDVPLLQWVRTHARGVYFTADFYIDPNADATRALDWWDALVAVCTYATERAFDHVCLALFGSMLARQWTLPQMHDFYVNRMIPELQLPHFDFLGTHAFDLFILAVTYKNTAGVALALWPTILNYPRQVLLLALQHLARHDDREGTLGRTLLLSHPLPGMNMEEEVAAYVMALQL